ncbi:MAG: helix-turn-helix domain-containing protein [Maritalea sp.]
MSEIDKSKAKSELLWPQGDIAACMPTGVVRDTRGANLGFSDRFNNFPKSPYCAISWILKGDCRVSEDGGADPECWSPLPQVFVSGPTNQPTISWNEGDVYAVTLGFLPDAWFALTGIDASTIANKYIDAGKILPNELLPFLDIFTVDGDAQEEFAHLQQILAPIWAKRRPSHAIIPNGLVDWMRQGLMQLATGGVGRSTRQIQRRIKHWTGLTQRELQSYARGEELYKSFIHRRENDDFSFSQIAVENGYADQSHLGRDVKRITGLSPKQLNELIDHEERFWYFRLLYEFYG